MADTKLPGGCLCGALRFSAVPANPEMAVCHCSMCRRWSGGVFMGFECSEIDFVDQASLGTYASSEYGERVFCTSCGTSLMWRMRNGSHTNVAASALDDPSGFEFTTEIFIDEKPDAYAFANPTQKLTGAEVFALFASNQDPQHG